VTARFKLGVEDTEKEKGTLKEGSVYKENDRKQSDRRVSELEVKP
jgi:hypothetical protein